MKKTSERRLYAGSLLERALGKNSCKRIREADLGRRSRISMHLEERTQSYETLWRLVAS